MTQAVQFSRQLELGRLRWQCRRGMRELDELLLGFLESRFEQLSEKTINAFTELLTYPDTLLLEYLMGRLQPGDRELLDVISEIRNATAD